MKDTIYRQAAIDVIKHVEVHFTVKSAIDFSAHKKAVHEIIDHILDAQEKALGELPSAEPRCIATIHLSQEQLDEAFEKVKSDILSVKPKTGKWTIEDVHSATYKYCCSECKAHHRARYDFCPTCGAKMLEEGGEDDE